MLSNKAENVFENLFLDMKKLEIRKTNVTYPRPAEKKIVY